MSPAREKWWTDCIKSDVAPYFTSREAAEATGKTHRIKGYFLWGDRVRLLDDHSSARFVKVGGRGKVVWVQREHLGGEPLLEIYVIDVGQGDGILLVTPEGHHVLIDGGNCREFQTAGKNAADFVDWKFYQDYLDEPERAKPEAATIRLDAVVASHCDQDHFGGLLDLLDRTSPRNRDELDCAAVRIDRFYHAGLSWWSKRRSEGDPAKWLGRTAAGNYVQLLGDRSSAVAAVARLDHPDDDTLAGRWGALIREITRTQSASTPGSPTDVVCLMAGAPTYLPGFAPEDAGSKVRIRVLGPVGTSGSDKPGLKRLPGGESINTNGHCVVLRVDYGERRILLTGDLNAAAQNELARHYRTAFSQEFSADVVKACHHGSHDASWRFLKAIRPLATLFSSGDAETYGHPNPAAVAAYALCGRQLIDPENDRPVAPKIYMTEVARSIALDEVTQMWEYEQPRPPYESVPPADCRKHSEVADMARYRLRVGGTTSRKPVWPRLDLCLAVKGLVYGLVNVRTDGQRLLFAVRDEVGAKWATEVLSAEEIAAAT